MVEGYLRHLLGTMINPRIVTKNVIIIEWK